MRLGMIGLGRMGANMVRRLHRNGQECVAFDRSPASVKAAVADGAIGANTLEELVRALPAPRAIWIMVPAAVVDSVLKDLRPLLQSGDIIIDGGNSHYRDDIRRAAALKSAGLHYLDVGTSGGVLGLEAGYCLMIGGEANIVASLEPIFAALAPGSNRTSVEGSGTSDKATTVGAAAAIVASGASTAITAHLDNATAALVRDAAAPDEGQAAHSRRTAMQGYLHCGGHGAGHFVKMVHNGIEYGLMAAYAEGLNVLRHADAGMQQHAHDAETAPLSNPEFFQYELDIAAIAEVWRHGSIISSQLLDLTAGALAADPHLENFAGSVSDSGEGRWTVEAAIEEGVPAYVLSAALYSRFGSRGRAEFADKLLSAMRLGFGGHTEKPKG